jgi:hypothetical protein
MATLQLEIKKKMDLSGLITYSLYVDESLVKSSNDISDIQALTQTIKDGFYRGDFEELIIYTETLDNTDVVFPNVDVNVKPSPDIIIKPSPVINVEPIKE